MTFKLPKKKNIDFVALGWKCGNRGQKIGNETCQLCGNRGKQIPVYECSVHEKCTIDPYKHAQEMACCKRCEDISE